MKLNGTRHISHDYLIEAGNLAPNYFENTSLKSISLNKNKFYKIKNLNIINSNTNYNPTSADFCGSIIISNDVDFLNNIYLGYLGAFGAPVSFQYLDAIGSSFTTYPFPSVSTLDIESMISRLSNRNLYNIVKIVHAANLYWYRVFETVNSFSGLLRTIPLTSVNQNGIASYKFNYSNYITDFSFYNNLSNRLNIFSYMSLLPTGGTPSFGIIGTIDFDLEEYEIE